MNAPAGFHKIRVRTADLEDDLMCAQIDDFVRCRSDSTPFHLTGWSRAVAKGTNVQAHYLIAEGPAGLVAVLPCHVLKSRLFGDAIVSTAFGVSGGFLGDWPKIADQMMTLGIIARCPVLELRGGPIPRTGWNVISTRHVSCSRALPEDADDILATLPRKRRANVRKALGAGLSVSIGRSEEDLRAHYRVYSEAMRNLGTPVFPKSLFREVLQAFGADAEIVTVRQGDVLLSSVLSLYHQGKAMPYWGGGTGKARALGANDLMYFMLMRHAVANKGCYVFDFGRSKSGSAHAAYKESFGCTSTPLAYARRVIRKGPVRNTDPDSPRYQLAARLWRHLPLPLAQLMGPIISKGLG